MAYALIVSGTARIQLPGGGEWSVPANELEFDVVSSSERQMGPENQHLGTFHLQGRENAPGVEWTVVEYPLGVLNGVFPKMLNNAVLLQDFGFEFEDLDYQGEDE